MNGYSNNIFYSAPEMILNNKYDSRSDVFSIGVLLFWLLTTQYP